MKLSSGKKYKLGDTLELRFFDEDTFIIEEVFIDRVKLKGLNSTCQITIKKSALEKYGYFVRSTKAQETLSISEDYFKELIVAVRRLKIHPDQAIERIYQGKFYYRPSIEEINGLKKSYLILKEKIEEAYEESKKY